MQQRKAPILENADAPDRRSALEKAEFASTPTIAHRRAGAAESG